MRIKMLLAAALTLLLSACATLYSTNREWRLPGGLGNYVLSARMNVGFLTRQVIISVNGRELLSGQSYFWEDSIAMAGRINHFPLAAVCYKDSKTCDVTIAGMQAATLKF